MGKKEDILDFIEKHKDEEKSEVIEAIHYKFGVTETTAKQYYSNWNTRRLQKEVVRIKEKPKVKEVKEQEIDVIVPVPVTTETKPVLKVLEGTFKGTHNTYNVKDGTIEVMEFKIKSVEDIEKFRDYLKLQVEVTMNEITDLYKMIQ